MICLNVRFRSKATEAVHDRLAKSAKENFRSLNAEIIARLHQSFAAEDIKQAVRTAVREELDKRSDDAASHRGKAVAGWMRVPQ
jgi:hypothetical protein